MSRYSSRTASRLGQRTALLAGPAAAVTAIVVVTVDGLTRTGYDSTRHWVSHLSLGERRWLGVTTLAVTGVLLMVFATAVRRTGATRVAAGSVLVAGVAMITAAAFPIDPGLGYPPGVAATHSTTGTIHDAAGGVLFLSLTIACALVGRAAGAPRTGYAVAATVASAFVVCSVLVAMDYAGTLPGAPSGLFERVALFAGLAWLGVLGVRLGKERA